MNIKSSVYIIFQVLLFSVFFFNCDNRKIEKQIYIPNDYSDLDFHSLDSELSFHRMLSTENIVIFWEKEFGKDIRNAPDLDGISMSVDIDNLSERLEEFYKFFRDSLKFVNSGSLSEKYKMICIIRYSTEGVAYGGSFDNTIGALWVTPVRLKDIKQNVLAHELGHSFQSQITCDNSGNAWGGHPFFEMTSQWMLWQVNKDWMTDENYHWEAFKEKTHKAFLHIDNIYHSPFILESWSERHGVDFIAKLFKNGEVQEDPVLTYKRITNISDEQFSAEMYKNYQQLINLDYQRVYSHTRNWANSFNTFKNKIDLIGNRYVVKSDFAPEAYGFNVIKISVPQIGDSLSVEFNGADFYDKDGKSIKVDGGWRYGFVAVNKNGNSVYGDMSKEKNSVVNFIVDDYYTDIWFLVMGSPNEYAVNMETKYPYTLKLVGTEIL